MTIGLKEETRMATDFSVAAVTDAVEEEKRKYYKSYGLKRVLRTLCMIRST